MDDSWAAARVGASIGIPSTGLFDDSEVVACSGEPCCRPHLSCVRGTKHYVIPLLKIRNGENRHLPLTVFVGRYHLLSTLAVVVLDIPINLHEYSQPYQRRAASGDDDDDDDDVAELGGLLLYSFGEASVLLLASQQVGYRLRGIETDVLVAMCSCLSTSQVGNWTGCTVQWVTT
jgi:hypothetical protein